MDVVGALLALRIDGAKALVPASVVTAALLLVLLTPLLSQARAGRWAPRAALASVVGAGALGYGLVWLLGDALDLFDFTFSQVFRLAIAGASAGLTLALVSLLRPPRRRVAAAVLAVPAVLVTAALVVNADFGVYRTLDDVVHPAVAAPLDVPTPSPAGATTLDVSDAAFLQEWTAPADLPAAGRTGAVTIPATVSGFSPRPAQVYLPPAALVADPPRLPVMVMFSGQPGSPSDLFAIGALNTTLDAYAAAHQGLAPIVVVPDQLGAPERNPMCVDSPLGDSASYVMRDVVGWISASLPVTADHRYWGVGGFSQGGTCTAQFGAAHPDVFRTWFDIAGEDAPTIGSDTVAQGFGGSSQAYEAATPTALLAQHAPYRDVAAIIGYGELDDRYGPETRRVAAAAEAAGIATTVLVSPGTSHDWRTVQYVFTTGIPLLGTRLGLAAP